MIIDCHTHIGGFGGEKPKLTPRRVKDLVAAMDESGVNLSFIISNHLTGFGEGVKPENLLEEIKSFSDKLRIIAHVDFFRLEEKYYLENLKKILDDSLVVGLKFFLGYQRFDLCDSRLKPLYKKCSDLNMPIVIHTGYLLTGISASESSAHPYKLKESLKKFPDNNFIAAHFGNPWVKECSEVLVKNRNLSIDLSGYFTEFQPLSREEISEFKNDIQIILNSGVDISRLLFGTDWPLYSQKEYLEAVKSLPLSKSELEKVLYRNACSIFNISLKK